MKNLLLTLFFLAFSGIVYGQSVLIAYEGKTIEANGTNKLDFTVKEPSTATTSTFLQIKINGRVAGSTAIVTLTENSSGTATNLKDYSFDNPPATVNINDADPQFYTIGIEIKSDVIPEADETLILNLTYKLNGQTFSYPITITIQDQQNPLKAKQDTSRWSFRIVTGSNFDFFDSPTFKNFAGDLQAFMPGIWEVNWKKDKAGNVTAKRKIGLHFGIYNYNYFSSDSSKNAISTDRYLVDPAVIAPVPGKTSYYREIYAMNSKTTYNHWGLYLNPIMNINSMQSDISQAYWALHFEVQARTQVMKPSKITIRKDSLVYSQKDSLERLVLQEYPSIRGDYYKTTRYDFNVGIGLPIKTEIKKIVSIYVNPTLGYSLYKAYLISDEIANDIQRRVVKWQVFAEPFFLFKGQIVTKVAPVDIALGWEYRTIGKRDDFLAMYLGAAITLDKLKK